MSFDFLFEADFLVDDVAAADELVETLHGAIGVPRPHERWVQMNEDLGFKAFWCRVNPSLVESPTRLEVIAPLERGPAAVELRSTLAWQGRRTMRTHATVLVCRDFEEYVEGLSRRRVPHRVDRASTDQPFDRVTVGTVQPSGADYLPHWDAGLYLRVLAPAGLQLPEGIFDGNRRCSVAADGAMVRIEAREVLVPDLDSALRTLDDACEWRPEKITSSDGCRRAALSVALPTSARLELIEPLASGRYADYATREGFGVHGIRVSVNGLDAKADDLRRRGTMFERLDGDGPSRLVVDDSRTAGICVEFVDAQETSA